MMTMSFRRFTWLASLTCIIALSGLHGIAVAEPRVPGTQDPLTQQRVGSVETGGILVPTGQIIRPAGQILAFGGRPVDMSLSPDKKTLYVKNTGSLLIVDAVAWKAVGELSFPKDEYGSMHGMAVSPDGTAVYLAGSHTILFEARQNERGDWRWNRQIPLGEKTVNPCGVALTADGRTACVGLSMRNTLAIVDLAAGKVTAEVPTGVCPFDVVLSKDGRTAYVSNFGGRHAVDGEHAEDSAGTPVVVDDRSLAVSGTLSRIDLSTAKAVSELAVGLHPSDIELSPDGRWLFVANANSDSVSIIATDRFEVRETVSVRPDPNLPFGSITNALAVGEDGRTLFVANGGNNAVAVVALSDSPEKPSTVQGFVPTGWFPGSLCTDGSNLFIAHVKGEGSRGAAPDVASRSARQLRGTVARVAIPTEPQLAAYTRQVRIDARVPQMLASMEAAHSGLALEPVPERAGGRSPIEHVVYVIKENRTYDQVFGDIPQGNGAPALCTYGREVTPNHHALAEEFVLLDNYYCNGVVSADGHQWATQGAITDYQEKMFGGHPRSYDFGTDALAYAGCNFLWDSVLLHGRSFRNYGEFDFPEVVPKSTWFDVYRDFREGTGKVAFLPSVKMETLRKYTCADFPGWNMRIPDALRIERFLREFREDEKRGEWPNLVIVYLPQDHTAGTDPDYPSPRACMADNDLALGRLVEAISHSRFWAKTAIFVNEDDPQDGWDHVDGHRSICLVISPYAKRRAVVSQFYNQLSVLRTIERILGLPSAAQLTASAPVMKACFTDSPDLTPYRAKPSNIPLDERNPRLGSLQGRAWDMARASQTLDLSGPDRINEDQFNRILWHASMGAETPYPVEFAGAHGKGLKALRLEFTTPKGEVRQTPNRPE